MKNLFWINILPLLLLLSCKEEQPSVNIDDTLPAPQAVKNVTVKNLPGGAVLYYDVPDDKNFLYVKAVYEIRPGVIRETKASLYTDTLLLDGFGRQGEYAVRLYSVGRNEKPSEPLVVQVAPEEAPVRQAFHDLALTEGFGGVRLFFENPYMKDFAFCLIADTLNNGDWTALQTFYSKNSAGVFSHSGLNPKPIKVGSYIRDRWGNTSDTLVSTLTPLFEYMIPKPYGVFNLPSDSFEPAEGNAGRYAITGLWDGITNVENSNIFANSHVEPMPQTFTVNLKQSATLSRIKVHQRIKNEYTGSMVKKFELYGSNSNNPKDDLFGGDWVLLGRFESVKPSGPGAITAEDRNYANVQGENFELVPTDEIPNPWVPVRFIRFRTLETYNGPSERGQVIIAEISLFGQSTK
ncbi:DUF4959 domain-containing protein [Sphingobacterium tabacisoli]|uniref:DUF4959 domain-containing protein n=1 Tax=Sphingobacterium tabacisoli TaxID=2044855 RepID=A0ABW5KX75_9SPHI|nr:DUF4959 domain-containing protein [Sphingobacterium tabacisoli]